MYFVFYIATIIFVYVAFPPCFAEYATHEVVAYFEFVFIFK